MFFSLAHHSNTHGKHNISPTLYLRTDRLSGQYCLFLAMMVPSPRHSAAWYSHNGKLEQPKKERLDASFSTINPSTHWGTEILSVLYLWWRSCIEGWITPKKTDCSVVLGYEVCLFQLWLMLRKRAVSPHCADNYQLWKTKFKIGHLLSFGISWNSNLGEWRNRPPILSKLVWFLESKLSPPRHLKLTQKPVRENFFIIIITG